MFVNLFGQYLVSRRKLTLDQLEEVKAAGVKTRVKLGLIAISEKILTEKQADEINRKQAIMDKRFGDIAIELGYLTGEQVSKLLDLQGNAYMVFCQTITDRGYISLSELDSLFEEYAESIHLKKEDYASFKSDDLDKIIPLFIPSFDEKCNELVCVAVRTINRLISTDLSLSMGTVVHSYSGDHYSYQVLDGDFRMITGFCGKDDSLLVIADTFAGEKFDAVDNDALDAVGEFINIINGLFATSLSYKKIQVDMMPPVLSVETSSIDSSDVCLMPITVLGKNINLIVGIHD